jgi:hypothetical protein
MTATATAKPASFNEKWRDGADNLLLNCAELKPGQSVLVISETAIWVERAAIDYIEERARALGAKVESVWTGRPAGPDAIAPQLSRAIEAADITIFNHMMGAMLRFRPIGGSGIRVLNYATTGALLDSDFSRVPFGLWAKAGGLIAKEMNAARRWRITCPLGSAVEGTVPEAERAQSGGPNPDGFALRTFPIGTHRPTSALAASGRIAAKWLASSSLFDMGTQGISLGDVIQIDFANGHVTGIHGNPRAVEAARNFLADTGKRRGKDGLMVNSWHIGTNPQAFSPWRDGEDLEAWMNLAHNNPRMLHFHAVGAEIPGEISVPLIDPTVEVDGVTLWERGRSHLLERPAFRALAAEWPRGERAFALNPAIGV